MNEGSMLLALTPAEADDLLDAADDSDDAVLDVLDELDDAIGESGDYARVASLDRVWEAIHRCLTGDGTPEVDSGAGSPPLNSVLLGGEQLYQRGDMMVSLATAEEVAEAAPALAKLDEPRLREMFFALPPAACGFPLTEEEFAHTLEGFRRLMLFVERAAREGWAVVFAVEV